MYENDSLSEARGIAWGMALSGLIWVVIYFCVGVFF